MLADSAGDVVGIDSTRCHSTLPPQCQSLNYHFASEVHAPKLDQFNQTPLFRQPPTTTGGACTRTGVGPYAAWMPRKSLHGRTCGVSHAGTRASARSKPKHWHENARCRAQDRSVCGVGRRRGATSGVGTRRKSIPGGSVAASMPPHGPAPGRGTALPTLPLLIGR
ncbi:hypothetical protein E1J24_01300 [Xanthomonas hortorum pv. pelargonii]|uniref:Uncharacterized protein n=3 Tax=Xanthomonas hortorum TaxID=56454 RepID=A0AAW9ZLK7_9XANT|nr:hypothetical protein [Xanthomonas hortorum pv. pelargonii]